MVGQTISHYRVLEKLGAGGMGVVYKAQDTHLGRSVAIKVLPPEKVADPERKRRFVQEAKAASALNHPNIITIYDIDAADGVDFIAMEYVPGKTLGQVIGRKGLPLRETLKYAVQVAGALAKAHAPGIVHRDLKPANVMVTGDGLVKVLDFGLAKLTDPAEADEFALTRTLRAETEEGTILGTPAYMSPEQAEGKPVDARSDIFSFGAVLYEMVTGRRAFRGDTKLAVLSALLKDEPQPVSSVREDVPRDLERIITRCLRKDRERRFQHMDDVRVALEELKEESDSGTALTPAAIKTVAAALAVLEFENLSHDPSMDWLGTGIAETLTADLTKLKLLQIVSPERVHRAAAQQTGRDAAALGEALQVRWVVTGSFQRAGNRVRITPRLLDVSTGEVLATGKVDGSWEDIFELQDRVVAELCAALRMEVDTSAKERIAAPETLKLEAYEHYAQGRRQFFTFAKEGLEEARRHFERAIELDPAYVAAYSALGAVYAMRFIHRADPDDLVRAAGSLERALELDPELAEPYSYLTYIYLRQNRIDRAIDAGLRAVAWQPDFFQAHYFLGVAYFFKTESDPGHFGRAAEQLAEVVRLDPTYGAGWMVLAFAMLEAGDYDGAERCAQHLLDMLGAGTEPRALPHAEFAIGACWLRRGNWSSALEWHRRGIEYWTPRDHMYREHSLALNACGMGEAHLRAGNFEQALADFRRASNTLKEYPRILGIGRIQVRATAGMSAAYAALGDAARATPLLAQAEALLEEVRPQTGTAFPGGTLAGEICHAVAIAQARSGHAAAALRSLEQAAGSGWRDWRWLDTDPELEPLRGEARFQALVERLRQLPPVKFSAPNVA